MLIELKVGQVIEAAGKQWKIRAIGPRTVGFGAQMGEKKTAIYLDSLDEYGMWGFDIEDCQHYNVKVIREIIS